MVDIKNLRTVKQLATENAAFSESSLRWLIFNATTNGLSAAIVRVGRRVLIDTEAFQGWLDEQRDGDTG